MKKIVRIQVSIAILFFCLSSVSKAQSTGGKKVYFETIKELFENPNDSLIEKEHVWMFTYAVKKQESVNKLQEEFNKESLKVESIQKQGKYYYVELNEKKIYTPELLYKRVQKLDSIAGKCRIQPLETLGVSIF